MEFIHQNLSSVVCWHRLLGELVDENSRRRTGQVLSHNSVPHPMRLPTTPQAPSCGALVAAASKELSTRWSQAAIPTSRPKAASFGPDDTMLGKFTPVLRWGLRPSVLDEKPGICRLPVGFFRRRREVVHIVSPPDTLAECARRGSTLRCQVARPWKR